MSNDELQAHIEEYKSTQQLLNTRYQVEHNIHYWSFILLIAFISLSFQFLTKLENQIYLYLLLIVPFPFHLLALMFFRNDLIIAANAKYYNKILRPRIKEIIGCEIWMREDAIFLTRKGMFNKFLGGCRYGTTLIAFPIFALIYFLFKGNIAGINMVDMILLIINAVVFLFIIVHVIMRVPKDIDDIVK